MDQNLVMTLGGGFFVGVLTGYALKKIIKILAIAAGLFLAGLVYLQYHQIVKINLDKLQSVSQSISSLASATTQISNNMDGSSHDHMYTVLANFGIPLTGSMATGFVIGFMRG